MSQRDAAWAVCPSVPSAPWTHNAVLEANKLLLPWPPQPHPSRHHCPRPPTELLPPRGGILAPVRFLMSDGLQDLSQGLQG